ncbi:MAG: hypothetical protein ACOX7R_02945 [Acetivibrionales bacterium]
MFTGKKSRIGQKGSLTAEAAIALPIFICMIVSITFFIKVVYTHQVIQNAINLIADELATESYIYHISGIGEIDAVIEDGIRSRAEVFREHIPEALKSYGVLTSSDNDNAEVASTIIQGLEDTAVEITGSALANVRAQLLIPMIKSRMKSYIPGREDEGLEIRLSKLNITDGLDFSRTRLFEGGSNRIDIVVTYKMNIPVPFKIYPKLFIIQKASANAWMGGDESRVSDDEDIWSLQNMQRGKRVREIFGANLPWAFPGISGFYSGKAVLIRSMDITADSYQTVDAVEEKLTEYIESIADYNGQTEPWGKERIVIKENDIIERELVLVIPKNPVNPEIKEAVFNCVNKAAAIGVVLRIEEYGYKMDSKSDDEN